MEPCLCGTRCGLFEAMEWARQHVYGRQEATRLSRATPRKSPWVEPELPPAERAALEMYGRALAHRQDMRPNTYVALATLESFRPKRGAR